MTETEKFESGRPAKIWWSFMRVCEIAAERGARRLWFNGFSECALWDDGRGDGGKSGFITRLEIEDR